MLKARAHVLHLQADRLHAKVPAELVPKPVEDLPVWTAEQAIERAKTRLLVFIDGCFVDVSNYVADHVSRDLQLRERGAQRLNMSFRVLSPADRNCCAHTPSSLTRPAKEHRTLHLAPTRPSTRAMNLDQIPRHLRPRRLCCGPRSTFRTVTCWRRRERQAQRRPCHSKMRPEPSSARSTITRAPQRKRCDVRVWQDWQVAHMIGRRSEGVCIRIIYKSRERSVGQCICLSFDIYPRSSGQGWNSANRCSSRDPSATCYRRT